MTAQPQINDFPEEEMTAEEDACSEEVHTCSPVLSSDVPKQHMSVVLSSSSGRRRGRVEALLRPDTTPALLKLSLLFSLRKVP